MKGVPLASEYLNAPADDDWICPGCYADLGDVGEGIHTCPECERLLEATIVYEPCCLSLLIKNEKGTSNDQN